jgi:O-antigen/teichoic acid export membrane protein
MLTLLVARVIQQGDIILLAFSLNNKELIGNYSIATILRIGLTLPVGVLGSILLPYMVTRINSKYQVAKFLFTSLLYGLAILTPICILVLFLPNMVMSNYFSKYLIITHYLVILLPALIFDSLNTLLNNFIVAFGRTELSFGIYAISCVSHILLSILLISNLGIHGIMISLGITYIQIFIISVAVLATLIKRNNLAEADLSNSNYL